MFGPKVFLAGYGGPRNVTATVTEKRAPTDESVRMLAEMEAAAEARIEKSIRLEANGFECVAHVSRDVVSDDRVVIVHFKLNNHAMKATVRQRDGKPEELGLAVVKAVSERIAEEVLSPLAKETAVRLFQRGAR